jgi:anti-sigma28 factor (negative regulator of flagellin synthesis)
VRRFSTPPKERLFFTTLSPTVRAEDERRILPDAHPRHVPQVFRAATFRSILYNDPLIIEESDWEKKWSGNIKPPPYSLDTSYNNASPTDIPSLSMRAQLMKAKLLRRGKKQSLSKARLIRDLKQKIARGNYTVDTLDLARALFFVR